MKSLLGQRLYLRIWLAVVLAVAIMAMVVSWIWRVQMEHERSQRPGREVIVRNSDGDILGQAQGRGIRVPGQGLEFQVPMRDGETLSIQLPRPPRPPGNSEPMWLQPPLDFVSLIAMVAVAVALGAYPIVRRLTQRLETVQRGVERWGAGDLSVRLPEQGQDEVASLAQRFNVAADRVQTLVRSHKALLANASHELRSPLARIRMALELLPERKLAGNQAVNQELTRNIAELDQLIDEILLASRLDLADAPLGQLEEVDLVGLAAEECSHADAQLQVAEDQDWPVVWGSARLLRRVLRNLLENARRYGRDPSGRLQPIEVEVRTSTAAPGRPARAEIVVRDHGPGVPPPLRERIFEPFYRLPGASEREGGVGLGLSLVRTIAERHGGQALCEAAEGGGARFILRLPLMAPRQ